MKLLLIQLSDMHCHADSYYLTTKIDKAISAIKTLGSFDTAILIFSGDLTDRAQPDEFEAAKKLLGRFVEKLSEELNVGFVNMLIVPGNHDMKLPEGSRGSGEILKWKKDEHIDEELGRIGDFFKYSFKKRCFERDKLCDVRNISIKNEKLQFCLLNSAPFSTRMQDNKQLHYFPTQIGEKLIRDPNATLKISVMHHHYEWFEDKSKELLKKSIDTDDITFFGHDHKAEAVTTYNGNGSTFNILMGGEFNLEKDRDCAFNAVTYESKTKDIESYEFNWSVKSEIFIKNYRGKIEKKRTGLKPQKTYLDNLLQDRRNISTYFTEYYVLPKLKFEGGSFDFDEHSESISVENIFNFLKKDKAIMITGNNGSGKTALLRYLYSRSIELDYLPLLIEKRDYKDNKIDKMFRDLFVEQYGTKAENMFDAYEQVDLDKKIVFIDDFDLISSKTARENLITNIINSGRLLIYTSKEKNQDIEEIVKAQLQGKTIKTISITPFYKETRDELVKRVCSVCGKKQDEIDTIVAALDYLVQCQTSLFSFTPENMLLYIKYFLQGGANEHKGIQTISMVFETNIRNSILLCEKDSVANVYLMLLEYIANQMYFELHTEVIEHSRFEEIIIKYNSQKKADINAKKFLITCIDSKIFKDDSDSFNIRFNDNNTFAYFVAKSISRKYEKNQQNQDELSYVMNHICFGINDTIILFLSFIKSNSNIVLNLADEANNLLMGYPEWDFENRNIPFIHEKTDMSNKLPSSQDKKNAHRHTEEIEKARHNTIRFKGIFDYDENDVNKKDFVILRALKYLQIVGRALIDQYGALDADEIDKIIDTIYSGTQKVVYAMLRPIQENNENIVQGLIKYAKENLPSENITEDQIRKLIGHAGTNIALNVMNDIAYNVSNGSTIGALRDNNLNNANHKIMQLMMEENVGNTHEFVSRAILLRENFKDSIYAINLISQIARKHIIYTSNIDYREIDRLLSGKILNQKGKSELLLEQGKNSMS